MPTYDYRCQDCGHEFELIQKMTDDPIEECPSCTGRVKRLIGAGAGIIFKGSGFYQTDYRSESYRKDAAKEKASAAPSGDSKSKSESKPTATSSTTTGGSGTSS